MRHYFIGIPIPVHVHEIAERFKEEYALYDTYKVLTHEKDLHVTLLYLGPVQGDRLSNVKSRLAEIARKFTPFSLSVNGLSYFGSKNGPRVVYLSVEENGQLNNLQQEVNNKIPSLLALPKSDRFVPHITIAKKRKTQGKTTFEKQSINPVEVPVSALSLFTIHPKQLPKYEEIATFSLGE